ncbi:MAG: CotH kinase family protein [Bacteroidales bacterium]|nr:CotH kinase family protein [Bacteroidales bacterium]
MILFLSITACAFAQLGNDFYSTDKIQEIRIHFADTTWSATLDSLYFQYGDSCRLLGDVTVNGKLFRNAGVRYKGFSSWHGDEIKNPYNIDLDYSIPTQNYQGHTKIKLSNVIHDPSFIREVLSYEIARKYMPASRANFARLYVNDSLIGLYTNVESVDKKFVASHYGSQSGSFFKGEPEELEFPFGENANLAYSHGTDSTGYMPFYKNESDYGWNELLRMIRILNTSADSVETVMNIDRTLWMHAFNYSLLNLDSYIGFAQNYYLYQDHNGVFNPIIWDLNMSFGSFRESDGSYNFLGLSIPKIKILDPLQHTKFSISPRPLLTNLLNDDTLKRMFISHIRTITEENFATHSYYERAAELQQGIDAAVQEDPHKFYTYDDFIQNIDTTVRVSSTSMLYPGIWDLVEARTTYLKSFPGYTGQPEISALSYEPACPARGEQINFRIVATNALRVFLYYRQSSSSLFSRIVMKDDGISGDGEENDGIFGASVVCSGQLIQYYLYAENDVAGVFDPARAAYEFYSLQAEVDPGKLVINEVRFGGQNTTAGDVIGNDWIELLNSSAEPVNLAGFILRQGTTRELGFILPDTTIEAGDYFLIYSLGNGGFSSVFSLEASDENPLSLYNPTGTKIESVYLGNPVSGKTQGRYPNGNGPICYMQSTPSANNYPGTTPGSGILTYPNPAYDQAILEFSCPGSAFTLSVYDISGKEVFRKEFPSCEATSNSFALPLDVSQWSGMYLLRLTGGGEVKTQKLIVY